MSATNNNVSRHSSGLRDNTTPPDAEAVARQALDRCYEGAVERGGYDVSAYCEARDAYREAVERRVRAECAESAVQFAMVNFDINGLSPSAMLLRDAVKNADTGGSHA